MADWTFLIFSGIILILLGFFFIIRGIRSGQEHNRTPSRELKKKEVKGGGVILIGPIPIIFGSDWRYAIIVMILAILMLLVLLSIK